MNLKNQFVFSYNLAEGVPGQNLYPPDDRPIAKHYFNIKGPITVALNGGTALQATDLAPAICNLIGNIDWVGQPNGGAIAGGIGDGRRIKGIPALYFWIKNYLENSVFPVNSGDALDTNLATQTYNVNFTICIEEFDPKWAEKQQRMSIYRGCRYNRPYWRLNHGTFMPAVLGNPDLQSYILTGAGVTYTQQLVVSYSVDYVMDQGMKTDDPCMDMVIEYLPNYSFGSNLQSANNQQLSDRELQSHILLLNTGVLASGAEQGISNIGIMNSGLLDTKFGGTPFDQYTPAALYQKNTQMYLSGGQLWPKGYGMIEQINRTPKGAKQSKTLLGTSGTLYVDPYPGAVPGGFASQSLRIFHLSWNLSRKMKDILSPFGPWGGQ